VSRLSKAWERTRSEPGLGRDMGAIIGLMVIGLIVAGIILSQQRVNWPWKNETTFQADFRDAPGIAPGNGQEVRIAGVTVGRISAADTTSEGHARLTMAIDPDFEVYQDARLVLRPKTPLNDMYVEMSPGTESAGVVGEDDVIPVAQTADPVQIDEVTSNLDERTRNALTALLGESDAALASAPSALPAGLSAATDNLRTFKPVVESLQKRRELIASLVTALSDISTAAGEDDARTRRLVASLATTLTTLAGRDDDIRAALDALPGVTSELGGATRSVQELTTQLDPTLRNLKEASGDLPSTLKDLGNVAGELEQTAVKARPVVQQLRPVVGDLRPFVAALRPALADVEPISRRLDTGTQVLTSRLTDLQAFIYNTASVVSLQDVNGGILRGQTSINTSTLPIPLGDDD
jgi:phospholipid/cholesterol/gamma-HCH transport system substrate-binding protein